MEKTFTKISNFISKWAGKPQIFLLALLLIIFWGVSGPIFAFSTTWQLVVNTGTTIITFLMVFIIQNSQNRDSMAIQSKLDELIRSIDNARNDIIGIENLTGPEIEAIRKTIEDECK